MLRIGKSNDNANTAFVAMVNSDAVVCHYVARDYLTVPPETPAGEGNSSGK